MNAPFTEIQRADTLGSEIKTTRASLMGLSMDVLKILQDIEDVDFGDFDDSTSDHNAIISRTNTQQSYLSQDYKEDNNYSTKIKKKLSESMHKINKIENVNMKKLAILQEIEHSISIDEDQFQHPISNQNFNDDAQSDEYNDDAQSDDSPVLEEKDMISNIQKQQQPLNRTRSKAKTQEHIDYLPKSYSHDNNNDNKMSVPPNILIQSSSTSTFNYDQMAHIMQQQSKSMNLINSNNNDNNHVVDYQNMANIMKQQSRSMQQINNNINYQAMHYMMKQQSQSLSHIRSQPKAPPRQKSKPKPPPPRIDKSIELSVQPTDLFIQRPIKEVARLLYDLVEKDDRKYKLHTYTNCFIGRNAITIMEENNLCLHRKHGVQLCREMEELNIIHHVLYEKGNKFGDNKDSLYQFTYDDDDGFGDMNKKSDLDVAFGLLHQVKTKDLLDFTKNGNQNTINNEIKKHIIHDSNGKLPIYTKLPSTLLQTLDLSNLDQVRKRHKSTISQFKETADRYIELPQLSGWMEKKSATGFRSWQKRWIIVRKTHILWSKQMMDTDDPLNPNERRKFNNSMTLLTIKSIRPVSSKRKRKFDIITAAKTYHFKCKTSQQRDLWLQGLQLHLKALADSMKFLRKSFIFKDTQ